MKEFETDTFKTIIHRNGFVELSIKNNVVFNTSDLIDSKNFITGVLGDNKAYFLVEAAGIFHTTKDVREMLASNAHATHHAAIAFCSEKLGHRILGELYVKINRPRIPTRFFNKRTDALKWLNSQMEKNRHEIKV